MLKPVAKKEQWDVGENKDFNSELVCAYCKAGL